MLSHYHAYNRALDIDGYGVFVNEVGFRDPLAMWFPVKEIPANKLCSGWIANNIIRYYHRHRTGLPWYIVALEKKHHRFLDRSFLMDCQLFHDIDHYWDSEGPTEEGQAHYHKIVLDYELHA